VTVGINDGFLQQPVTQTFTYTVTNSAPTMTAIADRTIAHNTPSDSFTVSVTDTGDNSTKIYSVEVSGSGSSYPLDDLSGKYGLDTADIASSFNYRGANEKYLHSSNGSNPNGGGYYVLMPDNKLYAWDGISLASSIATISGTAPYLMADFMTSFYGNTNVYATPSLLYNARKPAAPVVLTNRSPLYDVKVQYGLDTGELASAYNARGLSEKYLQSSNGSNAANGGYYVLMPTGALLAWNGVSIGTSPQVADLSTTNAYSDPRLLTQAQAQFVNDPAYDAKTRYGLATADLTAYFNARGQAEKYLLSSNGSNPAGSGYYMLMSNGGNTELRAWNGVSLNSSPIVATFTGLAIYNNPYLLYSITGQTPGVTATVNGSGQVTLTRDAAFSGTVRVTVTASDGAEKAAQTFLFNVTDNAPTLPAITNQTAATGSTPITVNFAAATDADNDPLQFRAAVSNNPLYLLKLQYGLDTADVAAYFNARGQNERYFISSNGSNSAHGGYYILTSTNNLYAWDGVSYASTVAQAPVATFNGGNTSLYQGADVYTTTSLLSNATTTPNLSSIVTSNLTASSMNIAWPTGFTGKFLVTFYVSDGVKEAQKTFLVIVN
jgi:hypothetical protein